MKTILVAAAFIFSASAAFAQNKEQVIGCWQMSSMGSEHIQLNRAGRFFFSDYNAKTQLYESLSGKWQLAGNKVTLLYEDRPKQTFTLRKNKRGAWELAKAGGFLFTKATPAECSDVDGDGDGD